MKLQVTISRTDHGANIRVKSHNGEASKDYSSWKEALNEAASIGLISSAEGTAARALPHGLPFHTGSDMELQAMGGHGFTIGKTSPLR